MYIAFNSSTIFWTETTNTGETQINSANINSREVNTILGSNAYPRNKTCSCSPSFKIAPTLAYARNEGQTELAFVDIAASALYISDAAGCHCNKVLQSTNANNFGMCNIIYEIFYTLFYKNNFMI